MHFFKALTRGGRSCAIVIKVEYYDGYKATDFSRVERVTRLLVRFRAQVNQVSSSGDGVLSPQRLKWPVGKMSPWSQATDTRQSADGSEHVTGTWTDPFLTALQNTVFWKMSYRVIVQAGSNG